MCSGPAFFVDCSLNSKVAPKDPHPWVSSPLWGVEPVNVRTCHSGDHVTLLDQWRPSEWVQPKYTTPLKAESFLHLAAEEELGEMQRVRRCIARVAGFGDGGGLSISEPNWQLRRKWEPQAAVTENCVVTTQLGSRFFSWAPRKSLVQWGCGFEIWSGHILGQPMNT